VQSLDDFELASVGRVHNAEQALQAVRLAREAADELSTSDRPRFVAGSMGPTTKAITVTGGVTFPELREAYRAQARAW
jgi:5-methyltetrahydrofolate--homocysteine methyltransferase